MKRKTLRMAWTVSAILHHFTPHAEALDCELLWGGATSSLPGCTKSAARSDSQFAHSSDRSAFHSRL